jgi:hypothetical protein
VSVFACGCECGLFGTTVHWEVFAGTPTFETTIVRTGLRAIRCNATNEYVATAFGAGTRLIGRVYLYFVVLPDVDSMILGHNAVNAPNVLFKVADSKLYARVGATAGASGIGVIAGRWCRVDFDFHTETGGADFCDVQVDGFACGQATATGASGASTHFFMGLLPAPTGDVVFDDIVLSTTATDYPLGPGSVKPFVPVGDGTHNIAGTGDFQKTLTAVDILNTTTDAYTLVDNVPLAATMTDWINMVLPPNATDYVECIFGPGPGILWPSVPPRAVDLICGINQAGTGLGNMEIRLNDNGTMDTVYTATGVAGVAVATGQVFKRKHYAAGPAGPWVLGGGGNGDISDLRIRFGSPGAVDVNPDQYFGCALIEAEFAESIPGIANTDYRRFPKQLLNPMKGTRTNRFAP